MDETIHNLAVELFAETFWRLFTDPRCDCIPDLTRRRRVIRQVDAVSDAAAQGLARFLSWESPAGADLEALFAATRRALASIDPGDVWPPCGSAAARARSIGKDVPPKDWPETRTARFGAALEYVVAAVWQAGNAFHAWEQVGFSDQYEPPRTLGRQLEELANRAAARTAPPNAAADEQFELQYRDYLLQRWSRIEVGTLRAVSAVAVGLDALFVMPRVSQELYMPRSPTRHCSTLPLLWFRALCIDPRTSVVRQVYPVKSPDRSARQRQIDFAPVDAAPGCIW